MAEEPTPDWMKEILGGGSPAPDGERPAAASNKKPAEVFLTHEPAREKNLPEGTAPRPQAEATHEGLPVSPGVPPEAVSPLGGFTPRNPSTQAAPDIPGMASPRIESWMNKDPTTWYPKDSTEWTRWRKQLSTSELYAWEKMRMETAKWHQMTRQPGGFEASRNSPEYSDYRKRYDEFMKRTVPRWRQHEQTNPPRRYRRRQRADLEALGGQEVDVA